jgi:putative tryptophan/tyrosine transport system substrate-binding protein
MRRQDFLGALGGAAAAWPLVARAQQPTMRHIAVLMATNDTDPDGRARLDAFLQSFRQIGWQDGRNVNIDIRWSGGSFVRTRDITAELVAAKPDVIVANSTTSAHAMKAATTTIPVVFVLVNEPVAQGLIASVARPGGNMTGFTMVDFSLVGKLVELLKTMAPAISRAGFMFNPDTYPYYDTYLRELQSEARRPVQVTRLAVRTAADIDGAVAAFAAQPGGGITIPPDPFTVANRAAILAALERHRLPHIFVFRNIAREGGLMSYGPDTTDIFRRAADYTDRILKGANPAELPAQAPNKFELVVNLKTAKALGLDVPPALLATANEVIE